MPLIKPFLKGKNANLSYRVHMEESESIEKVSNFLGTCFSETPMIMDRPKVIVCIGTDRSTGDSLGPLVGTKLQENKNHDFKVMGTLENPVHARNLKEHLEILDSLDNPLVLAVDACLGKYDSIGYIKIGKGSLRPGAGVNKDLPSVGHLHITGIVNVGGFMEYFVLQNTRLNIVMKMANIITDGLIQSLKKCNTHGFSIK